MSAGSSLRANCPGVGRAGPVRMAVVYCVHPGSAMNREAFSACSFTLTAGARMAVRRTCSMRGSIWSGRAAVCLRPRIWRRVRADSACRSHSNEERLACNRTGAAEIDPERRNRPETAQVTAKKPKTSRVSPPAVSNREKPASCCGRELAPSARCQGKLSVPIAPDFREPIREQALRRLPTDVIIISIEWQTVLVDD